MTLTDATFTDEQVDEIWRAAIGGNWDGLMIANFRIVTRAGLAAIPREPTTAMLRVNVQHGVCGSYLSGCALGDTWRAMYEAAQGGKPA